MQVQYGYHTYIYLGNREISLLLEGCQVMSGDFVIRMGTPKEFEMPDLPVYNPPRPETLVGALQDNVHIEVGKSRVPKVARSSIRAGKPGPKHPTLTIFLWFFLAGCLTGGTILTIISILDALGVIP